MKQTDFRAAQKQAEQKAQREKIASYSHEAYTLINREKGVTALVIKFFNNLHQISRIVYDAAIACIRRDSIDIANQLITQTGVGISIVRKSQLFYISGSKYVMKNLETGSVAMVANFSLAITSGVWFAQEQEVWFEGVIYFNGSEYPLLFDGKHIKRMDWVLTDLQNAVYGAASSELVNQPIIILPESIKDLLRLIQQQTQCVQVRKELSKSNLLSTGIVKHNKGCVIWQYFAEIPVANLPGRIVLNLEEQKIYLNFYGIKTRRRLVKNELVAFYPETNPEMHGPKCIRINALEGLELLYEFYGRDIKLPKAFKVQNSLEDADSEGASSLSIDT